VAFARLAWPGRLCQTPTGRAFWWLPSAQSVTIPQQNSYKITLLDANMIATRPMVRTTWEQEYRPKWPLAPIDRPLTEYSEAELRARTYGEKPYTAVDAALLLREVKVQRLPSDDALRDLAWIMQVVRAHRQAPRRFKHERRLLLSPREIVATQAGVKRRAVGNYDPVAVKREIDRLHPGVPVVAISGLAIIRALDRLHPGLAAACGHIPADGGLYHWHDTARFLAAWYRSDVEQKCGHSRAGPLCRFVQAVLACAGQNVTRDAIDKALKR
jgi:hypothetical protein